MNIVLTIMFLISCQIYAILTTSIYAFPETVATTQKYVDIYTNYPNLENIIKGQRLSDFLNQNITTDKSFAPVYVKMQSQKYVDPEIPQSNDRSDFDLNEDYISDEYSSSSLETDQESNIQKISRSLNSNTNSKQLESNEKPNENFFSKINSVIRNQFSRLFKFGKDKASIEVDRSGSKNNENTIKTIPNEDKSKSGAKKRFLNIFTILQFENAKCQAQGSNANYEGTCYHRMECLENEGVIMGACAKGYGVCCVFRYTCGGSTNQNISYFECNTGTIFPTIAPPITLPPTTGAPPIDPRLNYSSLPNRYEEFQKQLSPLGTCIFNVNKRKTDVRQLRIDFVDLDLRGPTNGNCITDRLVISGGNINMQIPIICGYNTGQHVYVDVGDVQGPIQLSVFTANPAEKRFRIKVSQIRAPCANFMNCLQYYTGPTGTIQSFNYDPSPRGLGVAQYFNNLNYAICIRKEPGYCSITYTNVQNGVESPFQFANVDANGIILIPPGQAGVEIFNCPDDYIVVNGIRLCGDRLNDGSVNLDFRVNAPVTDVSGGPFILPVRTNGQTVARGFKLYYRQNRCANT